VSVLVALVVLAELVAAAAVVDDVALVELVLARSMAPPW